MRNKIAKKIFGGWAKGLMFLALGVMLVSCSEDQEDNPIKASYTNLAPPVISSVVPDNPNVIYAGVGIVTLNGSNFSPNKDENWVYFNNTLGTCVSASTDGTWIKVRTANVVGDSIRVRATISNKSDKFSNLVSMKLSRTAVLQGLGGAGATRIPLYACVDANNNPFVFLSETGNNYVVSYDQSGNVLNTIKVGGKILNAIRVKSDGNVYGTCASLTSFMTLEGAKLGYNTRMTGTKPGDFDFDANGIAWIGDLAAGKVYRVDPVAKTFTTYSVAGYDNGFTAVKVNSGKLYLAGLSAGSAKISAIDLNSISGTSFAPTQVYSLAALFTGSVAVNVKSMSFATDGSMFVSTDDATGMVYVAPDGTSGLYYQSLIAEGVFAGPILSAVWGNGDALYMVKGTKDNTNALVLLHMDNKIGMH